MTSRTADLYIRLVVAYHAMRVILGRREPLTPAGLAYVQGLRAEVARLGAEVERLAAGG